MSAWQIILYLFVGSIAAMWTYIDVLQDSSVVSGVRQAPFMASILLAVSFWLIAAVWPLAGLVALYGLATGRRTVTSKRHHDRKPPTRSIW